VTFDEWGGFYDHVSPPRVVDDTNPAHVMHAGDSTTPTDGQLIPDYRQLGFRVPSLVVTNLAPPHRVVHEGPFEHSSSLALIESTFGLQPLTARDRHARNLQEVLLRAPVTGRHAVRPSAIPASSEVIGPVISPPSVSPAPVNHPPRAQTFGGIPGLKGTSGMADLYQSYRSGDAEDG
jgi:phospholipase C